MKLSELEIGNSGTIREISDTQLSLSLMRMGLVQGDAFTIANMAPWGGPIALRLRGGKVALRRSDAEKVEVDQTS